MRTRLALPLVALALAAQPVAATPLDSPMRTSESSCVELNIFRVADPAAVTALLPDGWRPTILANGRAQTHFVDYVCDELSIDGRPARRTIVSMVTAPNSTRADGTGGRRTWVLWHGTDNPHLVERLRSLGVESRYLPRSTADVTTLPDGRVSTVLTYVDDRPDPGIDYEYSTVSPEPTSLYVGQGGIFSFAGEHGIVTVDFQNRTSTVRGGTVRQTFAPESIARALGIADVGPLTSAAVSFTRGSWTSTITLLP